MLIEFDKMQGLGNDFIIIDASQFSKKPDKDFIINLCDRNYGIGCDQLVLYGKQGDKILARFFNPDGSEAEICGNAARCLGLLMQKRCGLSKFTLESAGKSHSIKTNGEIRVGMGQPSFDSEDIGISKVGVDPLSVLEELNLPKNLGIYHASCVSVGNPHLVLFSRDILNEKDIMSVGPSLKSHPLFRNKINVSFACVVSENEIALSVFERGVGLTFACGSGACAVAIVAHVSNVIPATDILINQKGGSLTISLDEEMNIFQTGPAFHVFQGEIEI
ncbi:MAG: diaminopimelate epimerase [Holosporaceae bacterium]|jgi:diaminopimelate epimerase|nr:diaminopimelate epimerase [Holosporaceae bacterium]